MQIGIDVGATKIESVILEDSGKEQYRSRVDCPKDYNIICAHQDLWRLEQGTAHCTVPGSLPNFAQFCSWFLVTGGSL